MSKQQQTQPLPTDEGLNDIELNKPDQLPHIEQRLEMVAELLAKRLTYRKIHRALAKKLINPETEQPYSLGTIFNDVKYLKEEWKARRKVSIDEWLDEELASLDVLEQQAWAAKDGHLVLKIKQRRAKYLGIDAPTITGDLSEMTDEQLERLATSGRL